MQALASRGIALNFQYNSKRYPRVVAPVSMEWIGATK